MVTQSRVLIVEDDPAIRKLLYQIIFGMGHTVDLCEDGLSAFNLLQEQEYQLLVTDIELPIFNGLQIVRGLRERGGRTPVLVVSSSLSAEDHQAFGELESITFVDKPFSIEAIRGAVSRLLPKGTS